MEKVRLGDILVNAGLITPSQLTSAVHEQESFGGKLGTIILEKCWITEKEFLLALTSQLGVPAVDFRKITIPESTIKTVPRDLAWELLVFPVEIKGSGDERTLVLAMADPQDKEVLKRLKVITGMEVEPVLALENTLRHVLMDYYQNNYGNGDYRLKADLEPPVCDLNEGTIYQNSAAREHRPEEPSFYIGPEPGEEDGLIPEEGGEDAKAFLTAVQKHLIEDRISEEHGKFTLELKAFLTLLSRKGVITTEEFVDTLRELRKTQVA